MIYEERKPEMANNRAIDSKKTVYHGDVPYDIHRDMTGTWYLSYEAGYTYSIA
jgi:hypothetical protein